MTPDETTPGMGDEAEMPQTPKLDDQGNPIEEKEEEGTEAAEAPTEEAA